MTLTIELPDALAAEFAEQVTMEERETFSINAIADAVALRQKKFAEGEARVLAALRAELDPEKEPERDAAECRAIIEEGLADVAAGRNLIAFEDVQRQWEAEKAAMKAKRSA